MSPVFFLVNTVLTVYLYIIILRLWMQYVHVNYYNPLTQFVIKLTQPIIGPLRKMLPSFGKLDTATILVLYIFALIKFIFIINYVTDAPYFHVKYLMYTLLVIIHAFGRLVFWILLVRAILSWVSRGQSGVEEVLHQLSEPLIAPIRRIIPPIGNIDLSFMIFVFALITLNMFAMSIFSPWWGLISL